MTELKLLRAEEFWPIWCKENMGIVRRAILQALPAIYSDFAEAFALRRLQPQGHRKIRIGCSKCHEEWSYGHVCKPAEAESSSAGPEPRCPKCGAEVYIFKIGCDGIYVTCQGGNADDDIHAPMHFQIKSLKDFAQFFPASQQVPQLAENSMRCIECKAKICDCVFRRLCDLKAAASQQVPGINWQNLYQHTEDALLALRIELGGSDYKTNALDHIAVIRRQLAASQQVDVRAVLEHIQWVSKHAEDRLKQTTGLGVPCIPATTQLNAYIQGQRDTADDLAAVLQKAMGAATQWVSVEEVVSFIVNDTDEEFSSAQATRMVKLVDRARAAALSKHESESEEKKA